MQHSSANPITYLKSLMIGRKSMKAFANLRSYVMFIGQPRSGTSLLGSLLNAHRNVLVSQELNALKYVRRGYSKNQLFWLIKENERKFARSGRKWTGYEYNVDSKWQGKNPATHRCAPQTFEAHHASRNIRRLFPMKIN